MSAPEYLQTAFAVVGLGYAFARGVWAVYRHLVPRPVVPVKLPYVPVGIALAVIEDLEQHPLLVQRLRGALSWGTPADSDRSSPTTLPSAPTTTAETPDAKARG
jgi:hypothetical protein